MNQMIMSILEKEPFEDQGGGQRTKFIRHPVEAIKTVDGSGNVRFLKVDGKIRIYEHVGEPIHYSETLTTEIDHSHNQHTMYRFHCRGMPNIDERMGVWGNITFNHKLGHADVPTAREELQMLNPCPMFGFEECIVCMEQTKFKNRCGHIVCVACKSRLKACPMKCGVERWSCECCYDEELDDE